MNSIIGNKCDDDTSVDDDTIDENNHNHNHNTYDDSNKVVN